jgi:hypothetical protein
MNQGKSHAQLMVLKLSLHAGQPSSCASTLML